MGNEIGEDDGSSHKRQSLSSVNSLNTFKSMSTYQTYITFATGNNNSIGALSRNESRRLLDRLEFTAEEEMLIKTLKKNVSTRSLLEPQLKPQRNKVDIIQRENNTKRDDKNKNKYEKLRLASDTTNNASKRVTSNSGVEIPLVNSNSQTNSFKFISSKYSPIESEEDLSKQFQKEHAHKTTKQYHKKTKSWSISHNQEKQNAKDIKNISKEEPNSVFVKQHKKKNSSFSIKNLFKKPNNNNNSTSNQQQQQQQQQTSNSTKGNIKYDSFQTFEHFQNNGNDEEFMDDTIGGNEDESNKMNSIYLNNGEPQLHNSLLIDMNEATNIDADLVMTHKRINLISSEVPLSSNSSAESFQDADQQRIQELAENIDSYMTKAILLKQTDNFTESTDCLLLSILQYKKKYLLLRKFNKTDDLKERTPFLLYGIALKMGIGCEYDLESSIENLKVACGLLPPVEFENDDMPFDQQNDDKLMKFLDYNNLLMPSRFNMETNNDDSSILGPAFYELSLNYLYPFLELSVKKTSDIVNTGMNYSLNQIQEGLKYLSNSIVSYGHLDSFPVLLEIFAKGIKMSKIFVIRPNKNNFEAWLKICDRKKIQLSPELRGMMISSFSSLTSARGFALKRNDTLERLNNLKDNVYLSSDDEDESSVENINSVNDKSSSTASLVVIEKNQFEEGATVKHYESDDEFSDIMNTYL